MSYPILDRVKGYFFRYAPEAFLRKGFYKTVFYLSRNRAFNSLNNRWAIKRIEKLSGKPPGNLVIESTNLCNAKCAMCIIPIMKRARGSMSPKLFEKIVKDASRCKVGLINLQYVGEPLMDERLFERIRLIKKYGLNVMFHTNGSLMDEEKSRLILETGVNVVGISIDALSKETYKKIRRGLPFEKVVENVLNLMEMKKREKASLPVVKVNYVILDENIHEVKGFYDFWRNKVDHVNVTFAHDWAGQFSVSSDPSIHSKDGLPFLNPCNMLWREMVVFHDGRVPLCCSDYEGNVIMGDLRTQGIMEVWLGEKFRKHRENILKNGRCSLPLCSNCFKYSFWV